MPSGRADALSHLPDRVRALLERGRRGVMTTVDAGGAPHSVPVVFAVIGQEIVSPIDHKPKSGRMLARVRNLRRDDRVALLIDHWDEDWTQLAWVMVQGQAVVDSEASVNELRALNARYPQYAPDERHDALIRIRPTRLVWWTWS
ncbi:MAG: pyridoxamine 5'-phosphate oxidase family protein [Actinomycetota bacterium]